MVSPESHCIKPPALFPFFNLKNSSASSGQSPVLGFGDTETEEGIHHHEVYIVLGKQMESENDAVIVCVCVCVGVFCYLK